MKNLLAFVLMALVLTSNARAAEETLKCPEDYDKIFMSFNVNTTKSMGFGSVYYCVLKGVLNTEAGLKSIIRTIKSENKITGEVTPLYFQVLKD